MPDWGDAVEKTMTQQVKGLGVCNEPTWLGPYLVHLYLHFIELHNKKMEGPNKRKAHKQTITDSDTEREEEVKAKSESQNATWIRETSGSKPQDTTMTIVDFKEWGILLHNLGRNTSRLFEVLHLKANKLFLEEVTHNLEKIFTPPPTGEALDL
ncbi:hypothetical protein R1flu_028657 [Riccia fluitans]|uniref:Uncharacterized protein n=1 Tax=Riccia fluitans TaxID=41844 RepID=A0ABD1XMB9_9MARC